MRHVLARPTPGLGRQAALALWTLQTRLSTKTLEILEYFSNALWTVENPGSSLLWQRPVARPLLEQMAKTSYCRFGFPYRKHTWFANNFELKLRPQCDGTCGQMDGRRHLQHAQRGGGGADRDAEGKPVRHSLDQLHSIPPALCNEILDELITFP